MRLLALDRRATPSLLFSAALPQILSKHSNVAYIVAGAAHPHILRHEGKKYRASLLGGANKFDHFFGTYRVLGNAAACRST